MIFRPLTTADVEAFKAIRVQATEDAPMCVYQTSEEESARRPEELRCVLQAAFSRVVGAFEGEKLIGISGIFRDPEIKRNHTARVRLLYVDAAHRHRGIARQLLIKAIDYAKTLPQLCQIKLSVNAQNKAAQLLYADLGFETYAVDPKVLRLDGQFSDEHLMLLRLL